MPEQSNQTDLSPEELRIPQSANQDTIFPGAGSLKESIDKLVIINEKLYRRQGLWYSFIHGLFVAIGSTIGLAVVLAAIGYILSKFGIFDSVRSFLDPYLITNP